MKLAANTPARSPPLTLQLTAPLAPPILVSPGASHGSLQWPFLRPSLSPATSALQHSLIKNCSLWCQDVIGCLLVSHCPLKLSFSSPSQLSLHPPGPFEWTSQRSLFCPVSSLSALIQSQDCSGPSRGSQGGALAGGEASLDEGLNHQLASEKSCSGGGPDNSIGATTGKGWSSIAGFPTAGCGAGTGPSSGGEGGGFPSRHQEVESVLFT